MNKFIIVLVFIGQYAMAQTVFIVKKDSSKYETTIGAYSKNAIFVVGETVYFTDLVKLSYTSVGDNIDILTSRLREAGVTVTFDYNKGSVPLTPKAELSSQVKEISTKDLAYSLELFRQSRQSAKAAELIGVLAIGGSILMNSIYSKQNVDNAGKSGYKPKTVSPIIPAVGLGLFTIGIAFDLAAGSKLKAKSR